MKSILETVKSAYHSFNISIINLFLNCTDYHTPIFCRKKILILSPHPDDEIFGLGGNILSMVEHNCQINIIYLTDGEGSGVWHDRQEIAGQRISLSVNACKMLNINEQNIFRLHLPDGSVPHPGQHGFDTAVNKVVEIIGSVNPDAVFATHPLDYWPFDHVGCAHIAYDAVKKSENKPQLWYYWVWAWYNLKPWKLSFRTINKLQKIDISDKLTGKMEIMDIYLSSLTPTGKQWSGILPETLTNALKHPIEILEKVVIKDNVIN